MKLKLSWKSFIIQQFFIVCILFFSICHANETGEIDNQDIKNVGLTKKLVNSTPILSFVSKNLAIDIETNGNDFDSIMIESSTARYLKEIAYNDRKTRTVVGVIDLILGATWISVGFATKDTDGFDDGMSIKKAMAFGFGGMNIFQGTNLLISHSQAEIEYSKLDTLKNTHQKHKNALDAIRRIAKENKGRRISRGIIGLGIGAVLIANPFGNKKEFKDNSLNREIGAICILEAIYNLSAPSFAERTLTRYKINEKLSESFKVQLKSNFTDEIRLVLTKNL